MKIPSVALILVCLFTACRKDTAGADATKAYQQSNISYGNDALQKMDVSLIAQRTDSTPLVVLIHGGGWMAGDKADLSQGIAPFNNSGINVVNINYRLTSSVSSGYRAADLLADVGAALKKIRDQSAAWHVRASAYVTFGFSAGAHLSLLYGYSYDSLGLVSAVIGFGTPTRFNDPAWFTAPYEAVASAALPPLTGDPWVSGDTSNATLRRLSPYYQPAFKPTFLIHGANDQTVPPSQSTSMYALLTAAGIATELNMIPNGGHSGEGASDADIATAYGEAIQWITRYSH